MAPVGLAKSETGGQIYVSQMRTFTPLRATLAIEAVMLREDNLKKLRARAVDSRELFVYIHDGRYESPESDFAHRTYVPRDFHRVLDRIWISSAADSAFVYSVVPGSNRWERYHAATGKSTPTLANDS